MRMHNTVDMSGWESWQRDYRFGVILVMPPPHVAASVDAFRQAYDPRSHAICSAHISVSDPLPRELTDDAKGEIRELLQAVEPFEVQYGRPTASTQRPGVTCPAGPQERFDELKHVLHQASVFEGVVSARRAIPAHMTIAEFVTIEESLRICAHLADAVPPGSFRCDRLEYLAPDATFRFHRRETFFLEGRRA
jgi:2'-5' RNA ligase superfamily protein